METDKSSINIASMKRIMLKLSGEILVGNQDYGLDPQKLMDIAEDIANVHRKNKQICIVVGGGNIFRGVSGASQGIDRVTADGMGMLATVINALALQNAIEKNNVATRVLSAIPMQTICESFIKRRAIRHLEKGRVIIFAAGTGNPYFSTDTAATLRAAEMNCDIIFKGTFVDGVYNADPKEDSNSIRYDKISYKKVLSDNLKVMDSSAISMARDNNIPMVVFSILEKIFFKYYIRKRIIYYNFGGEMSLFDLNEVEKRMISTLDNLSSNFQGIRTGRASTGLVDNLGVDAYGQNMKLKDLASVAVPEPRTIKINVWDSNMISCIEKALTSSSLGFNPMTEGQVIRINLPELTAERRTELAKNIRSLAEEAKISLRNIRQDSMNTLKKSSNEEKIPEDEVKSLQLKIQELTDKYVAKVADISKRKEDDIMKI